MTKKQHEYGDISPTVNGLLVKRLIETQFWYKAELQRERDKEGVKDDKKAA